MLGRFFHLRTLFVYSLSVKGLDTSPNQETLLNMCKRSTGMKTSLSDQFSLGNQITFEWVTDSKSSKNYGHEGVENRP